jgi:nucleotide-binding universal stress UspA family protein
MCLANATNAALTGFYVPLLPKPLDQSIVDEAQKAGADMIVMVTHRRSRVGKFVFGSHTKNVIIESTLPVLVLR